jgi:hypothetical protein
MLLVLTLAGPAFAGVIAQENFNAGVINDWDVYNGIGTNPRFEYHGTYSHHTGGNYPAGNSVFGGAGDFGDGGSSHIFHWDVDTLGAGAEMFDTAAPRTFEMWFSPREDNLGRSTAENGTFGGTLLILDGNGMFTNGNLFFFDNGVPSTPGQQLMFQSNETGGVESGNINLLADVWYHVAISWNATNLMIGFNGTVLYNQPHGGLGSWTWGGQPGGFLMSLAGSNPFDGRADDITVSDTGHYADPNNTTTYPVPTAPIGFIPPPPPGPATLTAYNNYDAEDGNINFNFKADPDFSVFAYTGLEPNGLSETPSIVHTGLKEDCGGALDPAAIVQSAAALGPRPISETANGVAGTIEMWISPNWNGTSAGGQGVGGSGAGQNLMLFTDGGGNGWFRPGVQLFLFNNNAPNDGGQVFAWWNDGLQVDSELHSGGGTTTGWTAGSWHHVAICWDPNEIGLYLNGQEVDVAPRTNPLTDPFSNGVQLFGFDKVGNVLSPWDGKIDDLAFWDNRRYFGDYQLPDSLCVQDTCLDVISAGGGIPADFDQNCDVALPDLIQLIEDWLRCNDPSIGGCEQTW